MAGTDKRPIIKLRSTAGTGYTYVTTKNKTNTRERIELKPVKWEVKNNIGIININGFSANTGALTREALIGIDKATVIGNSLGGLASWRFAATSPERNHAAVSACPVSMGSPVAASARGQDGKG